MAFEADCGVSTVLETLWVTTTVGYLRFRSPPAWCGRLARTCSRDGRTTKQPGSVCPVWDTCPACGAPCSAGVSPACDVVAHASRVHAAGTAAPQDNPGWFVLAVRASRLLDVKFEIRNSKFEISHYRNGCKNLSHRGR